MLHFLHRKFLHLNRLPFQKISFSSSLFSQQIEKLTFLNCTFKLPWRSYSIVKPGTVQPARSVPDGIARPNYIKTNFLLQIINGLTYKMKKLSPDDLKKMRAACHIGRLVLNTVGGVICPGVTTDELDRIGHDACIAYGAYPSPLMYKGFPKSICTSVNNIACHGIPDNRCLQDGDIINVDITVYYQGFHGDVSETFLVGNVDDSGQLLVSTAKRCRDAGISVCAPGQPLSIIGETISSIAEEGGYEVIEEFCGHGIGRYFHGPPDIIHARNNVRGKMSEGMIFTVEPVISEGGGEIDILGDGWTAVTTDNSRTAQFEHTVLITRNGVEILTE